MLYEGVLTKMQTEIGPPIQYYLVFENDFLHVNQLLGKTVSISHIGFQCLNCGLDKPIFRQGFCQSCFFEIPQAADWIMRPELSKAHLDKEDRDLEYEKKIQLQPHIVYLANSSITTSGNYERYFEINNKKYSHIVDPKTFIPASKALSTTIIAKTAICADAVATAVCVMGLKKGLEFVNKHDDLEAMLVFKEKTKIVILKSKNFDKFNKK